MAKAPTYEDIAEARKALRAVAVQTPVIQSEELNEHLNARVLIKAEALQRTGSFKFRGAYFRLSRLNEAEREAGVLAYSSGNFGRALAAAGAILGIPVTIVMPEDAPPIKMAAVRRAGAEIVVSKHGTRNREEAANELASSLAAERGAVRLHPFDDPLIVAGQGTAAVELIESARDGGARLDALLVPAGGGGLVAGCALAAEALSAGTAVYAVEPAGYDGMGQSLAAGERRRAGASGSTLCDALQAPMPGEVPFEVARSRLRGGIVVGDDAVRLAMAFAFQELKVVLEPSGAIGLAALLSGSLDVKERCVGVIASGGNIALEDFARLLSGAGDWRSASPSLGGGPGGPRAARP